MGCVSPKYIRLYIYPRDAYILNTGTGTGIVDVLLMLHQHAMCSTLFLCICSCTELWIRLSYTCTTCM